VGCGAGGGEGRFGGSYTWGAGQVVVSNLVDSNVFLRAVILSLEFFSACRAQLLVRPLSRFSKP
jgi:hypothetical protein